MNGDRLLPGAGQYMKFSQIYFLVLFKVEVQPLLPLVGLLNLVNFFSSGLLPAVPFLTLLV